MKHFSLVALLLHLFRCNLVFALFSPKQLEIFSVFVKPYGISFKGDLILNVSRKLENCTAINPTFKECNSVFVNLTSSTTEDELSKLESLSKRCPSGSYGCFYNTVKSDQVLQGWFIRMRSAFKGLCKEQCWQTLAKVINKCIQVTQSGIEESDKVYIQFVIEVLKSLCIQGDHLSCADKFVSGLLKKSSNSEVCKVDKNLIQNNCSICYKDLGEFYDNLGCCVGSVSRIMECYSVQPQNDSYGVFVKESYPRCHKNRPTACTQDTGMPCPSSSQRSPTPTSSASSSKGKQIAGICLAVIICVGLAVIVGNFLYRRMKRRAKIRFEDYGYSRLKMLEDDYYFDVEVDDDDENKGLVQL